MIDNKLPIWIYWENKDKLSNDPILAARCKSIFAKYDNVILLNEINIHNYIDNLIDCGRLEHIAQKIDYYRAKLLYEHGGIWLDIDTILLEDVSYLYAELLSTNFEMRGNNDGKGTAFNPQFLIFKPKSIIAEKWYKYDEEFIQSYLPVAWADLGGVGLGKVVDQNDYYNKIMTIPSNLRFDLGYRDKSYEQYYSTDESFINEKMNTILTGEFKYITLYGTFMYNLPIPENCLLDQMFKIRK